MSKFTQEVKDACEVPDDSTLSTLRKQAFVQVDSAFGWDWIEDIATRDLRGEVVEISKTNDPDMAQELQTVRDANVYLQGEIEQLTTERDQLLKDKEMLLTKVRDNGESS